MRALVLVLLVACGGRGGTCPKPPALQGGDSTQPAKTCEVRR